MTNEDLEMYIKQLLNTLDINETQIEIPNVILLLVVYMAGLRNMPFPLEKINEELSIKQELPEEFHQLVAFLSIFKSKTKKECRTENFYCKMSLELLEELRRYFIVMSP